MSVKNTNELYDDVYKDDNGYYSINYSINRGKLVPLRTVWAAYRWLRKKNERILERAGS